MKHIYCAGKRVGSRPGEDGEVVTWHIWRLQDGRFNPDYGFGSRLLYQYHSFATMEECRRAIVERFPDGMLVTQQMFQKIVEGRQSTVISLWTADFNKEFAINTQYVTVNSDH